MDFALALQSRLTTPEKAVAGIPSGSRVSTGMAVASHRGCLRRWRIARPPARLRI